jgi:hypothetical protein
MATVALVCVPAALPAANGPAANVSVCFVPRPSSAGVTIVPELGTAACNSAAAARTITI